MFQKTAVRLPLKRTLFQEWSHLSACGSADQIVAIFPMLLNTLFLTSSHSTFRWLLMVNCFTIHSFSSCLKYNLCWKCEQVAKNCHEMTFYCIWVQFMLCIKKSGKSCHKTWHEIKWFTVAGFVFVVPRLFGKRLLFHSRCPTLSKLSREIQMNRNKTRCASQIIFWYFTIATNLALRRTHSQKQ